MDNIPQSVTDYLKERLSRCDLGHNYQHSVDVANLAISAFGDFPEMEEYQRSSVILACLFHETNDHKFFPPNDLINIKEKLIHPNIDPRIPDLVEEMVDAVSCSTNGDRELSPPWKAIPRYADRTFATGDIGIQRAIIYASSKGRPLATKDTPRSYTVDDVNRNASPELWELYTTGKIQSESTIDHFYQKVLHLGLPPFFHSPTLQRAFETGREVVVDFIITYFNESKTITIQEFHLSKCREIDGYCNCFLHSCEEDELIKFFMHVGKSRMTPQKLIVMAIEYGNAHPWTGQLPSFQRF